MLHNTFHASAKTGFAPFICFGFWTGCWRFKVGTCFTVVLLTSFGGQARALRYRELLASTNAERYVLFHAPIHPVATALWPEYTLRVASVYSRCATGNAN